MRDIEQILISSEKIAARGGRIETMELNETGKAPESGTMAAGFSTPDRSTLNGPTLDSNGQSRLQLDATMGGKAAE